MTDLELAFHEAMRDLYKRALKCGYRATRFLQMVEERGGVSAARDMLHKPGLPDGLTRLYEMKKLCLSMEYLVLQPRWAPLFTEEERQLARKSLEKLDFPLD